MEQSLSRASAYQKRNRTTHSWYGDWSSAGCIMSQSLPSARTLEEHMRNARKAMSVSSSFYQPARPSTAADSRHSVASPPTAAAAVRPKAVSNGALKASYTVVKPRGLSGSTPSNTVPSSSASSPGPTTAIKILQEADPPMINGKPSTSYSYDGGFFVTANNANKDFFVIDPEWVSEEHAIKELPEGKTASKPVAKPPRVIRSYKRSKSAPPSKHRQNPITWQY